MDRSRSFRHHLLARFAAVLDLSIPPAGGAIAHDAGVAGDGTGANGDGEAYGSASESGTFAIPVLGRSPVVDAQPKTAPLRHGGSGWTADERPEVGSLGESERASLAQAWAADGLLEHASVASFGRFALELLSAGAPAGLVADAHRAALDEVRHARMCFALASTYAGETLAPGPFDFGRGMPVHVDLVALTERTFAEGCVGETLAAVHAEEQLAAATDPAVRKVLETIAEDGTRHAELAWRTIGWVLRIGGEGVRAALRGAMDRLEIPGSDAPATPALRSHGRLDGAASRAAMERTLQDVVLPCARGLLGSSENEASHSTSAAEPAIEVAAA